MKKRLRKKKLKKSMWFELFGTPELAAQTLTQKELACTSSHVGVACFGLDECDVCPFRDGLCGQGNARMDIDPCDFESVLELLNRPYRDTRTASISCDELLERGGK